MDWGKILSDFLPSIISAGASIIGGNSSANAAKDAASASAEQQKKALDLSRQIYLDQRGLSGPQYLTGGAAANKLAGLFGIAPQDYQAAYNGTNQFGQLGQGFNGTYNPADWGAGQPVPGHTGGGGPNSGASLAGNVIGNVFGGPVGGAVGSFLGGLFRRGGDNWTTLGTSAPQGYDYNAYMAQNPGLAAEWAKPNVQALFNGNRDAYAWWHYNTFGPNGKNEGWVLNPVAGASGSTTGTTTGTGGTGSTGTGATTSTAQSNPLGDFYSSPYFKLSSTLNNDQFSKIQGMLGASGKAISGAGEKRYAKVLAGNTYGAFGDYANGLRGLAGMTPIATQAITGAGNNYVNNASNAFTNIGNANSAGLQGAYAAKSNGINGAVNSILDLGKKQNWWA